MCFLTVLFVLAICVNLDCIFLTYQHGVCILVCFHVTAVPEVTEVTFHISFRGPSPQQINAPGCNPKSLCLVWPCVGAAVMQWLASRPTNLEVLCSDLQDESFEFRPPRQEFFDYSWLACRPTGLEILCSDLQGKSSVTLLYSGLAHRPTHQEVLCSDLQGKDSCNILVYMWPSNWSRDISWQVKMASMVLATLTADWCKKYVASTLYPIRVMM